MVHLPASLRNSLKWDENALAFSTDITPSLYYLLGQKNIANKPWFGRPLFTENLPEQAAYKRPQYLVASSYASVFGLLSNQGHTLYIADAVNEAEYTYDVRSDTRIEASASQLNEWRGAVRRLLDGIDELYSFNPR